MARLILSLGGQVLAEFNMTKERYTVGRHVEFGQYLTMMFG